MAKYSRLSATDSRLNSANRMILEIEIVRRTDEDHAIQAGFSGPSRLASIMAMNDAVDRLRTALARSPNLPTPVFLSFFGSPVHSRQHDVGRSVVLAIQNRSILKYEIRRCVAH